MRFFHGLWAGTGGNSFPTSSSSEMSSGLASSTELLSAGNAAKRYTEEGTDKWCSHSFAIQFIFLCSGLKEIPSVLTFFSPFFLAVC